MPLLFFLLPPRSGSFPRRSLALLGGHSFQSALASDFPALSSQFGHQHGDLRFRRGRYRVTLSRRKVNQMVSKLVCVSWAPAVLIPLWHICIVAFLSGFDKLDTQGANWQRFHTRI